MAPGLVNYSDSEDEIIAPPSRLPPLDIHDTSYKNEWLSFVYVPGTCSFFNSVPYSLQGLSSLLDKVAAQSHELCLISDPSQLHVSLTRPIILRKHEESAFAEEVVQAAKALPLSRYVASTHTASLWPFLASFVSPVTRLIAFLYAWN